MKKPSSSSMGVLKEYFCFDITQTECQFRDRLPSHHLRWGTHSPQSVLFHLTGWVILGEAPQADSPRSMSMGFQLTPSGQFSEPLNHLSHSPTNVLVDAVLSDLLQDLGNIPCCVFWKLEHLSLTK